ncbi:MAG: succinate dehydrogenase iron-sulfur subunit [Armatimonadota bacterium]
MADTDRKVHLKILRQDTPASRPYWDEFEVDYSPGMNVISCLMAIQRNPVNRKGERVRPVVWECNCLEEVCGACSMVINGTPRQACSCLVDKVTQPIELRPLSKFPVLRDLMVDRQAMFDAFKKVKAWVEIDGTHDLGPGPQMPQHEQEKLYPLTRCMVCGCCMEACPQYDSLRKPFIGPATLNQAHRFNVDRTGKMTKEERLRAVMEKGGIQDCGNAQNCVRVCPKEIPITDSIAELARETTKLLLKDIFG